MSPVQHSAAIEVEDEALDVRALLAKLATRRWFILASTLGFCAAFTAAAFLMTPVYRSTTILVPVTENRTSGMLGSALGQLGGLASIAGLNLTGQGSETEEALAVLHSRQFTEAFIKDYNLLPKLYSKRWDAVNHKWKGDPDKVPTLGKAYKRFDKDVRSVIQDKKTNLVTLQIDWKDRNEAADWANELVRRLNEEMRARAIAKADASTGYLDKELAATTTTAARDAIGRLLETQIKQRMLANVTQEYAFRVVDRALPADRDDPVSPQKGLLFVVGLLIGAAVGIGRTLAFAPRAPAADGDRS